MKTKVLNPESRSLEISASAVKFRPSPHSFSLPKQGNLPYRIPDNSVQCLTIPHLIWTQSGHSNKAGLNFKRKAKDFNGHKIAEFCKKWVKKGQLLYITGKLKHKGWKDKEGNQRKTTQVHIDVITLLGKKGDYGDVPKEEGPEDKSKDPF